MRASGPGFDARRRTHRARPRRTTTAAARARGPGCQRGGAAPSVQYADRDRSSLDRRRPRCRARVTPDVRAPATPASVAVSVFPRPPLQFEHFSVMAKRTKSKPQERGSVLFDVLYEDESRASNRRVPMEIWAVSTATSRPASSSRNRTARSRRSPAVRCARSQPDPVADPSREHLRRVGPAHAFFRN